MGDLGGTVPQAPGPSTVIFRAQRTGCRQGIKVNPIRTVRIATLTGVSDTAKVAVLGWEGLRPASCPDYAEMAEVGDVEFVGLYDPNVERAR